MDEIELFGDDPYLDGYESFKCGLSDDCNPFDPYNTPDEFWAWNNGWQEAEEAGEELYN